MQEEKQCLQCGSTLSGRSDKRFCSNQSRAQAHNTGRRQNNGEQLILSVNSTLRRYRTILK